MTITIRRVTNSRIAVAVGAIGGLSCADGTAPALPRPLLGVAISQRLKHLAVGDSDRLRFQMYDSVYTEVHRVCGE